MYLLFSRIIFYIGEKHSVIKARRVGWTFIGFDILSFMIQVRALRDESETKLLIRRSCCTYRRVEEVCMVPATNRYLTRRRLFSSLALRFRSYHFSSSLAVSSPVSPRSTGFNDPRNPDPFVLRSTSRNSSWSTQRRLDYLYLHSLLRYAAFHSTPTAFEITLLISIHSQVSR